MRNNTVISFLIIVLFSGNLSIAEEIRFSEGNTNSFIITENDYSGLQFSSSLNEMNTFIVKTKSGMFNVLNVPNYGHSMTIGDPKLPVLKKLIEIPVGADFKVNIIHSEFAEFDLNEFNISDYILPAQPPVSKSIDNPDDLPFEMNEQTYQTDGYNTVELVTVIPLGTMRGVNLARIEVAPVQYNPVKNKIRVCTAVEAEIEFTGGDTGKTIQNKKSLFSPYFEGIYGQLSNYKNEITDELIMVEPVTYIIVSDPMFQADLQPFIQWKAKKGYNVVEAYTDDGAVGTTTSSIKSYLQNFYNSPPAGYNPQSFVLFVGDIAQIPVFSGTAGGHYTDLYYCEYTGDIYPECYYGRFSAENLAELQPQIDKTLEYEQYLMPDPSFLDEVVMVTGDDASHELTWGNGQINYGTSNYFNLAHGITSHTYLQDEPAGGNYSQNIRQNVSDGVAYANYTAHCSSSGWADPSFVNGHVASLTNAHKYPLMVGNCCLSNKFDANDCFGETLLKSADKGALGYVGGSNNTYWDEDFWWGVGYEAISANPTYNPANLGAYDRTFHDNGEPLSEWCATQGQMPSAGNLAITQAGSSLETYYWEIYHLMGDPSLMIYFSQPPATAASYNALMPLGTTTFTVNTAPYAYVGISKDGTLHGAGIADATGTAEITLDPIAVPGTADVVVTRQNGQPFIGTVTVASPSGPYLMLDNFAMDDNSGNNNGLADFDEDILLDVTLENLGNSTATNVSAVLSPNDTYLTITDDYNTWPDIPDGTLSTQNGAFGLSIADDVPDQHAATFDLEMTDGSETWNSQLNITVNAPFLEAGNLSIDDVAGGNGNGRLDPGETADISIVTLNNGHSTSPLANAVLSTISPWLTINSGNASLGQINPSSSGNVVFNISCSASTPIGTAVDLVLDVSSGNYGYSFTYFESVGLVLEDWESGDFSKFPWTSGGNADWLITSSDTYEGAYCAQSGDINDSEISELYIVCETTADDNISFYKKVSSESNYDYLQFWIDGTMMAEWAGDVAWSQESYFVTAGVHTFKWVFDKDGSVTTGSDCGWIDYIVFPPMASFEPDIAIDPLFLDFGDVMMGTGATEYFTITNNGSDNLSGTITAQNGFTVNESNKGFKEDGKNTISFLINPGNSQEYAVLFEPLSPICYSEFITVVSNDPNQPSLNVEATGCGVIGPNLFLDPDNFNKTLAPDQAASELLELINDGDADLDYTAQVVYIGDSKLTATVYPDNENYWTGTTNGSTKTETSLVRAWDDEDGWFKFDVSNIPVGSTINSIELSGYVNYTYYPWWSATSLPMDPVTATASEIQNWVEANSGSADAYYYGNESSSFPTGWHNWTLSAQANTDLENALTDGWFGVGVDSRDNSTSYYILFDGWNESNPPYLVVDYTYNPPHNWLMLNGNALISGTVAAGHSSNISVDFDAAGLDEGTYNAEIYINSNDPDPSLVTIPVTLNVSAGYHLSMKVFLEGPYNGSVMNTELASAIEFPLAQPYFPAPWGYLGTESIDAVPGGGIVDWMLIELRDAPNASSATPATIISRQAGFVRSDGMVVAMNGLDDPFFTTSVSQQLFVVLYHRNHLAVMSANPLTLLSGTYNYDFTTASTQTYGGTLGSKELSTGVWGMYGSDMNSDGNISMDDIDNIWESQAGHAGYSPADANLDCQVDNKDKDDQLIPNLGAGCQVPE